MTPTPVGPTRTQILKQVVADAAKTAAVKHEGRHKEKERPRTGLVLITCGTIVLLGALAFDALGRPITLWLWVGIGALLIFCGYFARQPQRALQGGGFAVNATIGLLSAVPSMFVRKGRRADDPIVQVPVITETPQEFPAVQPAEIAPRDPTAPTPPERPSREG